MIFNSIWKSGSAASSSVFGQGFETTEDITTRNNSANNSFTTVQSITSAVLPAGKYRIEVKYFWAYDSGSGQPEFRVQVDGSSLTNDIRNSWETAGGTLSQRIEDSFVDYIDLTDATHDVVLQYRSTTAHDTEVYWSRITLWRVA